MLTIANPKKFDWSQMTLEDCCEGNAMDSYFTLKLFDVCEEKLGDRGMLPLFEKLLSPALSVFTDIERGGLNVSREKMKVLAKQLKHFNIDKEDGLYDCRGVSKTDNFSSNLDLIDVLYTREGGLCLYPPDKTAKGSPSVSAPTLKILLEQIEEELSNRNV